MDPSLDEVFGQVVEMAEQDPDILMHYGMMALRVLVPAAIPWEAERTPTSAAATSSPGWMSFASRGLPTLIRMGRFGRETMPSPRLWA